MKKTSEDELVFLPLGGSNEIGMNFNLYGYGPPHARKWIVVDVGVTFGDQTTPGVEIILPDPSYIEDYADDIIAIVLTHAHEDHIGAMGWLWPRLRAPIYATPFTAFLLREKMRDAGCLKDADITEVPMGGSIDLGPFQVTLVTLTHSIPEPNGLAIRTPLGTILHTGDWKIDPEPLIGARTDIAGAHRVEDMVDPFDPAPQTPRREMAGSKAEQGNDGPGNGKGDGEPGLQRPRPNVAAPDDQPGVGAKQRRPREHAVAARQADQPGLGHFGRQGGPVIDIARHPAPGRIGEQIIGLFAVAALHRQPIGDARLQFRLAAADIDVGQARQIGIDLSPQHHAPVSLDDPFDHQEQHQRGRQADQQGRQRDPAEDRAQQAEPSHGRRSTDSRCPRPSPARRCRTLPPACGAGARH